MPQHMDRITAHAMTRRYYYVPKYHGPCALSVAFAQASFSFHSLLGCNVNNGRLLGDFGGFALLTLITCKNTWQPFKPQLLHQ